MRIATMIKIFFIYTIYHILHAHKNTYNIIVNRYAFYILQEYIFFNI